MTDPGSRLGPVEKGALLGIARSAIRSHLTGSPKPELPTQGPLALSQGAFVTLTIGGQLRGCIGSFSPKGSLAATVAEMAVCAATEDPRFEPLSAHELDEVEIHISALNPRRRMRDPADLQIGRDGLLVQLGWHRGALLPRVAVENGWDRKAFLERACLKAGLPPHAWQDPEAIVELFSAEEMAEAPGTE